MASASPSNPEMEQSFNGDDVEQSFSLAAGEYTDAKREYLLKKGLVYETSRNETLDISTDVESLSSSNLSRIIFEENERLYADLLNKSTIGRKNKNSPMDVCNSSTQSQESPEVPLFIMSKEEEDKENEFKGPIIGAPRVLFQDDLEKVRDPLEEIKGITEQSLMLEFNESERSPDLSDNEICVVPCTQDVLPEEESSHTNTDYEDVVVVPCTQAQNQSFDLNQTYVSETFEESLAEELIPCTQMTEAVSMLSHDGEVSRIDTTSNVPCSQGSMMEGSSKEDELNDTIARMEHALKEADKLELKEKQKEFVLPSPLKADPVEQASHDNNSSNPASSQNIAGNNDDILFKTPLKHSRVQLLKNKKVASPSPPRSFANALLQQRGGMKMPAPMPPANEKKSLADRNLASRSSSSPMNTSTPKRTPAGTTTPAVNKRMHTPGRGGTLKTPVAAKVDSGIRSSPFPFGLSPVAKYIYDKPVPSKFARVQSVPNPKAASVSNTSVSRIPLPPSNVSLVRPKITPSSASKQPRHSILRTSTYFNMASTPPQIVGNEKIVVEKKKFQLLQYTGSSKQKALNGKVESPRTNDYVAHRHTDGSDNSSKRELRTTPVRCDTFVVSK